VRLNCTDFPELRPETGNLMCSGWDRPDRTIWCSGGQYWHYFVKPCM